LAQALQFVSPSAHQRKCNAMKVLLLLVTLEAALATDDIDIPPSVGTDQDQTNDPMDNDESDEAEQGVSKQFGGQTIRSGRDGHCLSVDIGSREIVAERCNGGRHQQWRWQGELLRSLHDDRCMDFAVHSKRSHMVLWDCHGDTNQRWRIDARTLRNQRDGRCISNLNGRVVRLEWCSHSNRNQQWTFGRSHGHAPPVHTNCCSKCGWQGKAFCSPRSGRCYDWQAKPYYQSCGRQPPVTRPPVNQNCCDRCGGKFCSPRSGRCYNWLGKPYYLTCGNRPARCCSRCAGSAFCSPLSGRCYNWKAKRHYQSCFTTAAEITNESEESESNKDAAEGPAENAVFYP